MLNNKSKGIYLSLVVAFVSGVSIFINKFAVDSIRNPLVFTTLKNVLVACMMALFITHFRKWGLIRKLSYRELKYLFLVGIIGGAVPFYLFFTGLSRVSAINGALIHKTLVIWVALMAIVFLREKITRLQWFGIMLIFFANFIPGGFKGFSYSAGELMILAAAILWAVENILAKKILPSVDPDILVLARMGIGSMVLLTYSVAVHPAETIGIAQLSFTQWLWVLVTTCTLFIYVSFWYRALKLSSAVNVTSVLALSTLVTNVLSAFFVTHSWNIILTFQSILIATGVWFFIIFAKNRETALTVV